jgi:DNA-binding MarR family transcriptional regulator
LELNAPSTQRRVHIKEARAMSPRLSFAAEPLFDTPLPSSTDSGVVAVSRELARGSERAFLSDLAELSAGIGWVQLVHCLHERGVLRFLEECGENGSSLGVLAARFELNPGYANVVLRVLAAEQWLERRAHAQTEQTRVALSNDGKELCALLDASSAVALVSKFSPIAQNMSGYLFGDFDPPASLPSLAGLAEQSANGWGLAERSSVAARRLLRALDGNLIGPVAVALKDEFYPGFAGRLVASSPEVWRHRPLAWWLRRQQCSALFAAAHPEGQIDLRQVRGNGPRMRAAFAVLERAGWLDLEGDRATFSAYGAYAAERAWAFGVPVSYLALFERIEQLLFGDATAFWSRPTGSTERHVDRTLNVKASGAAHARYFEAADRVVLEAFNRPFAEQPAGFVDMGSGDGAWLEHVWHLIVNQSDRGRLMRAFPKSRRYELLMVGADYNEAALNAARQRLTRAGIPHLALFGDINDPHGLRARLAGHGVDSRTLLHGSSFLVHNRPYTGVKDVEAARAHQSDVEGAYAWRGQVVPNRELEQNLVEFFQSWCDVIGRHGMLIIELHDPERVALGKTLTNYMLTHGLSDQFTVPLKVFRRAASRGGLTLEPHLARCYPSRADLATVSVSHFRKS